LLRPLLIAARACGDAGPGCGGVRGPSVHPRAREEAKRVSRGLSGPVGELVTVTPVVGSDGAARYGDGGVGSRRRPTGRRGARWRGCSSCTGLPDARHRTRPRKPRSRASRSPSSARHAARLTAATGSAMSPNRQPEMRRRRDRRAGDGVTLYSQRGGAGHGSPLRKIHSTTGHTQGVPAVPVSPYPL
jgi:hypothetical protein